MVLHWTKGFDLLTGITDFGTTKQPRLILHSCKIDRIFDVRVGNTSQKDVRHAKGHGDMPDSVVKGKKKRQTGHKPPIRPKNEKQSKNLPSCTFISSFVKHQKCRKKKHSMEQ